MGGNKNKVIENRLNMGEDSQRSGSDAFPSFIPHM
jgi:hypothetical protein